MTAEIFLASTLGCLVAFIVVCVFTRTIYMPLQRRALLRAALKAGRASGEFVTVGADYVPCPLESPEEQASSQRQYEAQQTLCLAALDARDGKESIDGLVAAALAYRRATTPRMRKQMRAMAAFRKVQHEPEDPV